MPILLLVWFFVLGAAAKAAVQPDHLWHFDECGGSVLKDSVGAEDLPQNSLWIVGKSQCAISQPWQAQYSIDKIFSSPLPAGELTLSFYWRNSAYPNEGRNHLYLKKADGAIMAGVRTSIYTRNLFFDGGATSTIATMPGDSDWHLITITYGRGSLAFYLDGLAKAFYPGDFTMHGLVSRLEIGGENWPVDMDELAIWPKALSAAEAAEIYQAAAPLEPYTPRPAQEKARLVHSWHFDEGAGAIAADSAGATALNPIVKWTAGKFGVGIEHTWENGYLISQELDQPIDSKDLSIDFWWKNNAYPNEGRVSLKLQNSAGVEVFGIRPSMFGGGYYFDGAAAFISNLIPGDGAWHHLALVYNSHNFYLAFYVDGVEKIRAPKVWFRQPITKLVISGENWFYGIDELAIWQGALSQQEIADYYNSGQPHGLAAPAPDPVIIVPGILGSWNISGRWQIDPIFHTYDNLMEALIAAGYKEDSLGEAKPMLFTFPYDWRQDNNLTANLLKEKIQQVKEITGASQVDIVAHSMGGLVARSYAQGSDYQNDIDQVIFLGTPHRGAVDTYLKYEGAAFTGQWVWPQKFLFQIEAALNGYFDLVDYIRVKVPTVEQLLPVYDYLKDQQPDNSYQLRPYPLNYPQNIYLEDLNSQAGVDLLKQRVKITNIVSDLGASSTLNYLRVIADPDPSDNKWQSGYPENLDNNLYSLEMGNGDDTVPLKSANSLTGVETIESVSADHTNLPTIMQKEIIKTLTGTAPDNYFNSKITSTIKRWAFFRVYSPVDFAVIAPDGKKIGKDFLNNVEINQIPDAFYSGFNSEAEFVLIPNPLDGEYKVELQGVAKGGEYTLVNSLIDGDKEISKEFTGTIAPEQEREFTVDYTAAADNPISDLAPVDTVPPVITITSPLENSQYPHNQVINIDYTAADDFSGLASTTITIDGQAIAAATLDLFYYLNGEHALTIAVSDRAGNLASSTVKFKIISSLDSVISDIARLYALGWITDRTTGKIMDTEIEEINWRFKLLDEAKRLIAKYIKKVETSQNTAKIKAKLIQRYHEDLERLDQKNSKNIGIVFDRLARSLGKYLKAKLINQAGYDIIMSDINYLRNNL